LPSRRRRAVVCVHMDGRMYAALGGRNSCSQATGADLPSLSGRCTDGLLLLFITAHGMTIWRALVVRVTLRFPENQRLGLAPVPCQTTCSCTPLDPLEIHAFDPLPRRSPADPPGPHLRHRLGRPGQDRRSAAGARADPRGEGDEGLLVDGVCEQAGFARR
jgi:hypothetical protein